jgi:hypothetical protein
MNLQAWLGQILTSGLIMAQNTLNVDNFKVKQIETHLPLADVSGAYIPFITAEDSILLGFCATTEGSQIITRDFLEMETPKGKFPREVTIDCFKEIANIFNGLVKRQMFNNTPIIKSGLPMYIDGNIKINPKQQIACAVLEFGQTEAYVIIIHTKLEPKKDQVEEPLPTPKTNISIQEWMGETLTASYMLSQSAFGSEHYKVLKVRSDIVEENVQGVYTPLIGTDDAVLVGFLSSEMGFRVLTGIFLGMPPNDPELTAKDKEDAIKEILSILIGMVKRQMFPHVGALKTGFPIFVDGAIEVGEDQEAVNALIEISTARVYLTVIRKH